MARARRDRVPPGEFSHLVRLARQTDDPRTLISATIRQFPNYNQNDIRRAVRTGQSQRTTTERVRLAQGGGPQSLQVIAGCQRGQTVELGIRIDYVHAVTGENREFFMDVDMRGLGNLRATVASHLARAAASALRWAMQHASLRAGVANAVRDQDFRITLIRARCLTGGRPA